MSLNPTARARASTLRGLLLALAIAAAGTSPARAAGATEPPARPAVPPAAASAAPDPLDPRAAVPPLRHSGSLARRAPAAELPALDWREANERVRAVGGWRAYLREAQRREPGAAQAGEEAR